MKTLKFSKLTFLAILLSTMSLAVHAGQLYRFPDENGSPTISKVLPPSAAQKGYDILDDKSLRLIKRVAPALSADEIAELERKLTEQLEAQHRAEIAAKEEKKRNRKQAIKDQILQASYHSEQDLLNTRDADLLYRKTQIEKETAKHEQAKQRLHKLQQQAAEQELSGKKISVNLK